MRRYEYRIYPLPSQAGLFVRTFGCVRFVYNKLLRERIDFYEQTGKSAIGTPAHLKSEFPWLAEVDSLALCNAQIALQSAFSNFFEDESAGFPRFKSKKNPVKTYTTNCVSNNIEIVRCADAPTRKQWKLKLPKVGLVNIVYHRHIPKHLVHQSRYNQNVAVRTILRVGTLRHERGDSPAQTRGGDIG